MAAASPAFRQPVWSGLGDWHLPADPVVQGEACDLVVVGAGILGLTTALSASRAGLSVRVVEAARIGEGSSGVNGGQVIPGLKYDPDWLVAHLGAARGGRLVGFAARGADQVFDLIRDERLAVPLQRKGWIQAAVTQTALAAGRARATQWGERGVATQVLDAGQIAALTGAKGYLGGWMDPRAGVIDPLAYVQELARIACGAGARLAEGTRAVALARDGKGWQVTLAGGAVLRAKQVILATNALTDGLYPGLARTLVPLQSFQIATPPLPPDLAARILPGGQAVSDSRRILVYYRKGPDGGLILGGRGRMSEPRSAADWAHLTRAMTRLYPELTGMPIVKRWFGRVAMTPDHLPHLHNPEPGLWAFVGCQGRGVALMTAMGLAFGPALAGGRMDDLAFPVSPIRPIPLHGLRQVGVAAAIATYRLLDAVER